ncbi:hypothetical protein J22TS1_46330 [Siminovitchia terrae]|nr:hypothetical protein J22TS1_46330 [Siminovitchia terrae]
MYVFPLWTYTAQSIKFIIFLNSTQIDRIFRWRKMSDVFEIYNGNDGAAG